MAGFMSGLRSFRYEGKYKNGTGADLPNGYLVAITPVTDGGVTEMKITLPAAAGGVFRVIRKRAVYEGEEGLECMVEDPNGLCLVENLILTNDSNESWDGRDWTIPKDALCRVHVLEAGEYIVTDAFTGTYASVAEGAKLKAATTGKLIPAT